MATCKKCFRKVDARFSLCYACAHKEKEKRFAKYGKRLCKRCKTIIPGDLKYCYHCAKK